jgi:GH35 family endo-1,4-beta-xylanase
MKSLDWLDSMKIRVRGHCLLWADTMLTITSGSMSKQEIIEKINYQISDKSKTLKGRIYEWDMHNHPIMSNYITKKIGKEALLDFWKLAQAENPNVRLAINEGSVLRQPFQNTLKYKEHIAWLLENKAPVQSIGFMSHFSSSTLNHPENVLVMLDDFAKFKLPLIITEFDMSVDRSNPEEIALQNDFTRDFLTVCFSHPAVDVFMSWGFWAGSHWKPEAAYYDTDWTLRPNGKAYMDLVFGKWWTNENLKTDQKGAGLVRGFKGDYNITAKLNGLTGTAQPKLVGDSIVVKIVLK